MTIAFFGHSHYVRRDGDMERVVSLIREIVCAEPVQLFLGGYGKFDDFAYECARSYKVVYGNTHIAFVTPYLDEIYQKNKIYGKHYDEIIYPPIEGTPPRYAITKRNRWIAENSDAVICYIVNTWGGAYRACEYARRKGKRVYNIY